MKKIALFLMALMTNLAADPLITEQNCQLLVVLTPDWEATTGFLARFERDETGSWQPVGEKVAVSIGKAGLAWGRGLHPTQEPLKKEGDRKSPAGLFSVGHGFGMASKNFSDKLLIDYIPVQQDTVAVDDSHSCYYNQIVHQNSIVDPDWKSAEMMSQERMLYFLGVCINHNYPEVVPGAGSAIFFHIWRKPNSPTAGCTATSMEHLAAIMTWLDAKKQPLVAQLPAKTYLELKASWGLPELDVNATLDTQTEFVDLMQLAPDIRYDIRYATDNNFLGFQVYPTANCYLHKEAAKALMEVQKELSSMDLGLLVFDGYRPLSIQQIMWNIVQDERYVSNPAKNRGRHTRGTAIDLTLVDKNGKPLEMPTEFDDMTELAHSDNPNVSQIQAHNRALLREVMERHHFVQFPFEWWHYDLEGWKDDVKYPSCDSSFDELAIQH